MERERGGRPRYPGVLTPAEQRVLEELRDGGSNAEIAARLGISRETVKTHIASMLSKLDLPDRYALAAWRPEPPRRGARGWLGLLVRPAAGLGAATGVGAVIVIFAVVIGASREFEVVSCESGIAVTNPATNAELVVDCESLLGLRDSLRGTAALNWTAGKPMSDWTGVTVSGTPQRVTALNLSGVGLDGQLSGLLGNLTGLTTLNLGGNALTGMLPSKLALLMSLTTVSIDGTSFTGCAPPVLRQTATNDVVAGGLDADCGAPSDLNAVTYRGTMPAGTYRWDFDERHPPIIFDIPPGVELVYGGLAIGRQEQGHPDSGSIGFVIQNADRTASLGIDAEYRRSWNRGFSPGSYDQAINEAFDRIVESLWAEER